MTENYRDTGDPVPSDQKPIRTVFLSYRFADGPRFDVVQQLAVRLRFFSIEVVLDQRGLDYGHDIKEYMRREIRHVDAIILVITEDYNRALLATSGPGEGVRFEARAALQEKERRPDLRIIPLLLDGVRPVPPFDRLKCAIPEEIDDVVTQLGLATVSAESRVLRQRYRIDLMIETRGYAQIFRGWDMVADLPIEINLVAAPQGKRGFDRFERVVKGRSSAFSPFLLNVRDTYVDSQGGYYLITERFDGEDLGVHIVRDGPTHPFGALCLAFQVALALHELHSVGVVHGGLSPLCIRLNPAQTSCKIIDFTHATTLDLVDRTAGAFEGYPAIMPPERLTGAPVSIQQDLYQLGNLILNLVCGKPAISRSIPPQLRLYQLGFHEDVLEVEDPRFRERLLARLVGGVRDHWAAFPSRSPWLNERIGETNKLRFLSDELVPLLTWCLAPRADDRPKNCLELMTSLGRHGIPLVGHLLDPDGRPVSDCLFPHRASE